MVSMQTQQISGLELLPLLTLSLLYNVGLNLISFDPCDFIRIRWSRPEQEGRCYFKYETSQNSLKNDNTSLRSILAMVKDTMNPFDSELDPIHLYNIGTGEAVSDNTEKLLFTIKNMHI